MTVSALDDFDVPKSLTIAIGGTIGFIGVKKISTIISTYFSNRFGGGNPSPTGLIMNKSQFQQAAGISAGLTVR